MTDRPPGPAGRRRPGGAPEAFAASLQRDGALDAVVRAWVERHPSGEAALGAPPGAGETPATAGQPGPGQLVVSSVEPLDDRLPRLLSVLAHHAGGVAPSGRAEHTVPSGRAEHTVPSGRAEHTVPSGHAGGAVHAVVGLRSVEEELCPVRAGDDTSLGLVETPAGPAVAVDALFESDLAVRVVSTLTGETALPAGAVSVAEPEDQIAVTVDDRLSLTVFSRPLPDHDPGVELLMALDEAGFNHLAAPVARWRRAGMDVGVVQELTVGMAGGWALALTSLRDLYASGLSPEKAGGDFAPEADALGIMTARMHVALAEAFGARADDDGSTLLRTHGDLHLGRTARTDHGWILVDPAPGGCRPGTADPQPRSPLADVADLAWAFQHVAAEAAAERDPTARSGLAALAEAWAARNRAALLEGYLDTADIGALVPDDREALSATLDRLVEARGARG